MKRKVLTKKQTLRTASCTHGQKLYKVCRPRPPLPFEFSEVETSDTYLVILPILLVNCTIGYVYINLILTQCFVDHTNKIVKGVILHDNLGD